MNTLSLRQSLTAMAMAVAMVASHAASAASENPAADAAPVTRASLQNELRELRAAGYDMQDNNFPESLQRAQRKLDAQRAAKEKDAH